jgi:hypothetical protein
MTPCKFSKPNADRREGFFEILGARIPQRRLEGASVAASLISANFVYGNATYLCGARQRCVIGRSMPQKTTTAGEHEVLGHELKTTRRSQTFSYLF